MIEDIEAREKAAKVDVTDSYVVAAQYLMKKALHGGDGTMLDAIKTLMDAREARDKTLEAVEKRAQDWVSRDSRGDLHYLPAFVTAGKEILHVLEGSE